MGLFDTNDEIEEKGVELDDDSKIRLFETHQKTSKSIHDYIRKFLPVAVVAAVLLGLFVYFMSPGIGDQVRAPDDVYDAVHDHMLMVEKRSPVEMTFYKCDGFYWVKVLAEPKPFPPSNLEDPVNQFRLTARQQDGKVQVVTLQKSDDNTPCQQ